MAISSSPLPGGKNEPARLRQPWILYLGTYDPREAPVDILLPPSIWCQLKRLFDIWTIVGAFTRVVGKGADAALFGSIPVGQMVRYMPFFETASWASTPPP